MHFAGLISGSILAVVNERIGGKDHEQVKYQADMFVVFTSAPRGYHRYGLEANLLG